ncbi:ATP-binding cassette domain-containing protein [Euryarchaeota archaeon]|nr:ATP-binding cassette domain-containing protein [Euryarchaeota archaeon]MDC0059271.1 ATP-binding cassette domain-containing protein [Euryarchaeota archaeon]
MGGDSIEEIPWKIEPIIRLNDVSIGYKKEEPLVQIPNLEIFPGEIVAIAGPSGVGKSTLLKTIAGLIRPISGSIEVCGKSFPNRPNRGELGYVPQSLGLVRHASVLHNVMLGANAGHNTPIPFIGICLPSFVAKKKSIEAINSMGLGEKISEPIRRLSGGQQRRVATARTLAQCPELILADEFLSELDEKTVDMVLKEVTTYVKSNNSALLVVEHDITRAKMMADRLLVIDDGRVNPFITEPTAMEVKI